MSVGTPSVSSLTGLQANKRKWPEKAKTNVRNKPLAFQFYLDANYLKSADAVKNKFLLMCAAPCNLTNK